MEILGQKKNGNLERSRVVGVEILEQGCDGKYDGGVSDYSTVYDIEVEGNHNFVAAGVLVSNCHEFKNLSYSSRLNGVLGLGNKDGSQRAMDVFNKIRVMRESGGRGGVTFATGTPISNSIVEMYNLMRYLGGDTLNDMGLGNFDAWHKQFAEAVTAFEMNEAGGLVEKTRMVRFSNMPELMALYYQFADAVTLDDIKNWYSEDNGGAKFPIPSIKGGKRQNNIVQPTPAQEQLLKQMVQDFESLPMIQDPKRRNAERLRLMDRARKISLDARAVNPRLPGEDGGKLSVTADNVARIYREWDKHKGTQLVFLDRSIPKNKGDDARLAEYDSLLAKLEATTNISEHDDIQEQLEKFDSAEMRAIREAQRANWNAYDELKRQFIARGIPANQIAFIQEANTDKQKQDLFDKVNAGDIRVLIGSTPRMGAGTNVQQRIVALHHVDVTWKPSDIEQREGRAERQGNLLYKLFTEAGKQFEIELHAYATERTYDAKMWNIVESKMRFINALRKYDGARDIESNDQESENMAEMAAMASGDPLMLERVKLDSELKKMEMLRRAHSRKQYGLESQINAARKVLDNSPAMIEAHKADEDAIHADRLRVEGEAAERTVDVAGKSYYTQREANDAALNEIEAQQAGDEKKRYTVTINGKPMTSKQKIGDEISATLGDDVPFEMVIDGKPYIERSAATKALVAKATEMAMESNSYQEAVVGKFLGLPLSLFVSDTGYGLSLAGSKNSYAVERYFLDDKKAINPQNFSGMYRELLKDSTENVRHHTDRLAAAKRDLPELESQHGKPFAMEDEFKAKTERLAEVTKILAEKKSEKLPSGEGDMVNDPVMSMAGNAISAADMMSESAIVSEIEPILARFNTEIPVRIVKNIPEEVARFVGVNDGDTPSGFVYDGKIWLVRSGIADPNALRRVLFHELLHFGIRRFMPKEQYIRTMKDLYDADKTIQNVANAWSHSDEAKNMDKKGHSAAYIMARATDEALATVSEELNTRNIEGLVIFNRKDHGLWQSIKNWVAGVARKLGFDDVAKMLYKRNEDVKIEQATKDFVMSIFGGLKSGRVKTQDGVSSWAYSDPAFSKSAPKKSVGVTVESARDEDDEGTLIVARDRARKDATGANLVVGHLHIPDGAVRSNGWSIGDIHVAKDMRRRGIASMMLDKASKEFGSKPTGATSVFSDDGKKLFDAFSRQLSFDFDQKNGVKKVTDTPEFKKWFGNSKVVDEQGNPMVVYHGTSVRQMRNGNVMGDIEAFDRMFTTQFRPHSIDTVGSWFSTNPGEEGALMYAGGANATGAAIYPVYLSIQNPHETHFKMMLRRARLLANGNDDGRMVGKAEVDAYRKWLKDMGKDGIKIVHDEYADNGSTEFKGQDGWIALEPEQIKSATGNNGGFDPGSPNIMYSKDGKDTDVSPSAVRSSLVDRFGERGIMALEKAGVLKITRLNEAPDEIRQQAIAQGASALYGSDGVAYLFSDRMTSDEAPGKLLHEIGEHQGLERLLGEDGWSRMKTRIANMAKVNGSIAYGAWHGVKAKYGEFEGMTDSELAENERFLHEVLAAIGENKAGLKTSLWREILAAVKEWMESMGLMTNLINEGDIANLVAGSLKNVMREAEAGLVAPKKMDDIATDYFKQIVSALKSANQLIEDCA